MNAMPNRWIVEDERRYPAEDAPLIQPFMVGDASHGLTLGILEATGGSATLTNREGLALALSQVTAARLLPPLVDLPTGMDLLNYRVNLGESLDPILVRELSLVLESRWKDFGWEQLEPHTYLSVIGAGVAACIETTPGDEQLYLRYNSSLANELFHAGRAIDLPRSRLFLQSALHEKVNQLLAQLRERCWQWF